MSIKKILAVLLCLAIPVWAIGEGYEADELEHYEAEEFGEMVQPEEVVEGIEEISVTEEEEILEEANIPTEKEVTVENANEELQVNKLDEENEFIAEDAKKEFITAKLNYSEAVICPGDEGCILKVSYSDQSAVNVDGTLREVKYVSDDTNCVSVDSNGVLNGIDLGVATITAVITYEGKTEEQKCEVQVLKAPESIDVLPEKCELEINEKNECLLEVNFPSGYGASCTFYSDDEDIATVDENGRVRAVSAGVVNIKVQTSNGKSTIVPVTVYDSINWIKSVYAAQGEEELVLVEGTQKQLVYEVNAYSRDNLVWSSSDAKVVQVDDNGIVVGLCTGKATITVISERGGAYCEFPVTIVKDLELPTLSKETPEFNKDDVSASMTLNKTSVELGEGMVTQLEVLFGEGAYSEYKFESNQPDIAKVDPQTGIVTAIAPGDATVTAMCISGTNEVSCSVHVNPAPKMITLENDKIQAYVGTKGLRVQGICPQGTQCDFQYTVTEGSEIVSVDSQTGELNLLYGGIAKVKVSASNNSEAAAECLIEVLADPAEILISKQTITIGKGNSLNLLSEGLVTLQPEGSTTDFSFSTSSKKTVSVTQEGEIKGKKEGSAKITVRTSNGLLKTFTVKVKKYPSSMKLSKKSIGLGVDMSAQLNVKFGSKTYSAYKFVSSKPDIASVDPNTGAVTAVAPGDAVITAKCISGKKKASCKVHVNPAPNTISFENNKIQAYVGKKNICVKGVCEKGTQCAFIYSVIEGNDIVSVDPATGMLAFLREGTAKIIVTASNNVEAKAECEIEVFPAPEQIIASNKTITIGKGNSLNLLSEGIISLQPENSFADYSFSTSSKKIVGVTSKGVIKGVKVGSAKVTVRTHNGLKMVLTVKVKKYPSSIKFSQKSIALNEGLSKTLEISFNSKAYSAVRFSSSAPEIAEVNERTGRVTAVHEGTAEITCYCVSGKVRATCSVVVMPAPTEITMTPNVVAIGVNDSLQISARLNNQCEEKCEFFSLTPELANIDRNTGEVFAIAEGTARIQAVAYNGLTSELNISILESPQKLEVEGLAEIDGYYDLRLSGSQQFSIKVLGPYTHLSVSYSSMNNDIAEISSNGVIATYRSGSVDIVVTAYNGTMAVLRLNVDKKSDGTGKYMVAHAMGGIDGNSYTNSLNAFKLNYSKGHRVFEVDFSITSDNEIVLWHDWDKRGWNGKAPTLKKFKSTKIFNKYTSMSIDDLIVLMQEYPDIRIITDSKDTSPTKSAEMFTKIVKKATDMNAIGVLKRLIVQFYSEDMYYAIDNVHHFDSYIFTLYKKYKKQPTTEQLESTYRFCDENGVGMVTMWDYYCNANVIKLARQYDIAIAVHTVNKKSDANKYLNMGVTAVYTDDLGPL